MYLDQVKHSHPLSIFSASTGPPPPLSLSLSNVNKEQSRNSVNLFLKFFFFNFAGLTSLFYWSIGILPFKDDFFTYIGEEKGCPYHSES